MEAFVESVKNGAIECTYRLVGDFEGVQVDCKQVFDVLTDPTTPKLFHPLIIAVNVIEQSKETCVVDYTDKMNLFGCLPYKMTYRAVWSLMPDQLTAYAHTYVSGTKVCHKYSLVSENKNNNGNLHQIIDEVYIKAPFMLQNYVVKTARKAHKEGIEKLVEYFKNKDSNTRL